VRAAFHIVKAVHPLHRITFLPLSGLPVMSASLRRIPLCFLVFLLPSCDARENGLGPGTSVFDHTAPTVVTTVPANGATQVGRTSPITVTFSEPMAATSMIASTFVFSPSIGGTWSYTGNTATFVPAAPLSAGVIYSGTVTTAAEDRSGNNLVSPFTWTFTSDPGPVVIVP
jgi:hypothetical protein